MIPWAFLAGLRNASPSNIVNQDEIRSALELELDRAMLDHEREGRSGDTTGTFLANAIQRYLFFVRHNRLPENMKGEGDGHQETGSPAL